MALEKQHEIFERRRSRNRGVLFALVAFAALLFAVTIVKLRDNAANPTAGATWGESLLEWVRGE
ncbi:MAG: hypothetical protein AAF334_01990 [Pseudomonadota bacterium]